MIRTLSRHARFFSAVFAAAVTVAPAMGQESRGATAQGTAIEAALSKVSPSLVRIHVVAFGYSDGRELKREASGSGTIITPEGHVLTNHHVAGRTRSIVCTLANREEVPADLVGTDPLSDIAILKLLTKLIGSGGGAQGVEITSETTDVKMRLSDGREIQATIALRDEDLNIAFIRPTAPPDKPLVAINLADAAQPAILDQVVVFGRLGRVGGWVPSAALRDIGGIIQRPRTFFVLAGEAAGVGMPAFLLNGKVVGVLTVRQIETERSGPLAAMSGPEGLGLLAVILPAAEILEIAKQATEKK